MPSRRNILTMAGRPQAALRKARRNATGCAPRWKRYAMDGCHKSAANMICVFISDVRRATRHSLLLIKPYHPTRASRKARGNDVQRIVRAPQVHKRREARGIYVSTCYALDGDVGDMG